MNQSKQRSEAKLRQKAEERRKQELVSAIKADFERRQAERKPLERSWEIAMEFLSGNQYCDLMPDGEIGEEPLLYGWQDRRVYNHIAPTVETRLAKLAQMRPEVCVKAFSDEDADLKTARLSADILKNVFEKLDFLAVVNRATVWSETCGTVFYAVAWDNGAGNLLAATPDGRAVREGEVSISVLPPFELYPDSLATESLAEQRSVIRARAVSVEDIEAAYGVRIAGEDLPDLATGQVSASGIAGGGVRSVRHNAALLIERYFRPCPDHPEGRLEIVAGDTLLYEGELPFLNGEYRTRTYPFVRQICLDQAGSFFGTGIVDRLIPVQRAYNAVRNRKQEFLNRLSMGVLTVEDGSLDTQALLEEGLSPGKVLVYRQGSEPPKFLDCGSLPSDFEAEETRLLEEFTNISGTSEIARNSLNPVSVTSATGLQLLIDQDDARLAVTAGNVESAEKEVSRQVLRLYKQFAGERRLLRMTGEGKTVRLKYFAASDISADDILFETGEASNPVKRQSMIFDLLAKGLFSRSDGTLSDYTKNRILDALGFGDYSNVTDLFALQQKRAQEENHRLLEGEVEIRTYDDPEAHLAEHTRYLLSEEGKSLTAEQNMRFEKHMAAHRSQSKQEVYNADDRERATDG